MTAREEEEYRALRATIRERGTARVWVFVAGFTAWAALTFATAALALPPVATLLPLLMLSAVFEAVFSLHVGVERVGRYLQVFHEASGQDDAAAGWEHTAMAFGPTKGAVTIDALFSSPFLLATLFNISPALIADLTRPELIVIGGAHALFVVRLLSARMAAGRQRAIELARFQQLKRG